jgi:glycosyltransferase involved in cell wall biosynthesis
MEKVLLGIRIARISTVPFFVVAQLKDQIIALATMGAQVDVVASAGEEMSHLEGLNGVRCVPIDIPRNISLWRDLMALYRLYLYFRRERIQIAHSTTPKAGLLTAVAAYLAGVPIRLHTFTGQPWSTMLGTKRWLARASDKVIGVLNTHCYADSGSQADYLISQSILKKSKMSVVGSGSLAGVNIRRFDQAQFSTLQRSEMRRSIGIADHLPVLLFVGRITPDKGVRELLQAYAILKAKGSDVHLVFVGRFDNDGGVAGSIAPLDILQLPDTHIIEYTEYPEKYFAIADILCLPSYREGFGTVVIEAAAMSVPTVGSNIYGLTDAIEDGVTGRLVSLHDIDELTTSLAALLNDNLLRKKMGIAARQRAIAHFDSHKVNLLVVNEYLDYLRDAKVVK